MDLSIVLVGYKMQRELPRTILSLCAPYQRDLGALQIEIIVIANDGTDRPAALASLPNLRWMRAPVVSASPVPALNFGISQARGRVVGAWIDGARLASPGLLRGAWAAWSSIPNALVATFNYHIGPVRHALASSNGYTQQVEDTLLESIGWPEDGYKLFAVSTPEAPTVTSPILETNAPFMARETWERLGGYDTAFDQPGGGWANPDLLTRATELDGVELIRLVGEGTFHQFHGGVTTSDGRQAAQFVKDAAKHYSKLRGRPPGHIRQVGRLFQSPGSPIRAMT